MMSALKEKLGTSEEQLASTTVLCYDWLPEDSALGLFLSTEPVFSRFTDCIFHPLASSG